MIFTALVGLALLGSPKHLSGDGAPEISADGRRIYFADGDGSIGVFDAASLERTSEWKGVVPKGAVFLTASWSGKLLLAIDRSGTSVSVHEATNGKRRAALKGIKKLNSAWFSADESKVIGYGQQAPPFKGNGWAFFTWALPSGKLEHTEPMTGAIEPVTHPSTGRNFSSDAQQTVFAADGSRIALGSGTFDCVASTPTLIVFHVRKDFGSESRGPLLWVDPAKAEAPNALAAITKCDHAFLNAAGTRVLISADSKLTVWDIADRAKPKAIAGPVKCELFQDVAPDLSFAICDTAVEGEPLQRVDLVP